MYLNKFTSKRRFEMLKVLELYSEGYSYRDIGERLNISFMRVENILKYMNEEVKVQLPLVITNEIPLQYKASLILLRELIKRAVDIENNSKDDRVRLQAISTISDLNTKINSLMSDANILSQSIMQMNQKDYQKNIEQLT